MPIIDTREWMQQVSTLLIKEAEIIADREITTISREIEHCHSCRGSSHCSRHQTQLDRRSSLVAETQALINLINQT